MPQLDRDGEVFVLDLGSDENRLNPTWIGAVMALLDEVAAAEGPRALVTTATGKIWSNGIDLEWLMAHYAEVTPFIDSVHGLFARVLSLPVPTVAACQGHVFAAGGMLALAHDFRVMRADRGFFCLPEVDIDIPFTAGMSALIVGRLTPQVAHDAMTTGRRYGGEQALAAGIVDAAVAEDAVRSTAVEQARALTAKAGPTLGAIKEQLYVTQLAALRAPSGGVSLPA
ncbi:MAG: enoyl-CoA hydratase [Frankiales bacterium]|nr:enoyl-CoA hydratase [Frankiales bacterium]